MKRMYRRFYSEKVFDDSNSDKPILRWRYRNFFGDHVAHDQRMNDSDLQSDSHAVSHDDSDSKKVHVESKQVPVSVTIFFYVHIGVAVVTGKSLQK